MTLSSSFRRAAGALLLTAALVVSGTSLEGALAAPSDGAGSAADHVSHRGKGGPKQKLTLTQTTPGPIVSGSTVAFAGTAPGSLSGKKLKLFRRVGAGEWVKVGGAKIAGGSFSVAGIATGQETNSWYVSASVKKGRKGHKHKKTYISGVVGFALYAWYPLTDDNSVGGGSSFYGGRVDIGAETFTTALIASDSSSYDTFNGEWNLSYKCLQASAAYGLDNGSATGSTAAFSYSLDGVGAALETKGLGPASRFTIDVSTRLRLKLTTTSLSGGSAYKYPTFANAAVLCSANPF